MVGEDEREPSGTGLPFRCIYFIDYVKGPSDPNDGQGNLHRPDEVDGDEHSG